MSQPPCRARPRCAWTGPSQRSSRAPRRGPRPRPPRPPRRAPRPSRHTCARSRVHWCAWVTRAERLAANASPVWPLPRPCSGQSQAGMPAGPCTQAQGAPPLPRLQARQPSLPPWRRCVRFTHLSVPASATCSSSEYESTPSLGRLRVCFLPKVEAKGCVCTRLARSALPAAGGRAARRVRAGACYCGGCLAVLRAVCTGHEQMRAAVQHTKQGIWPALCCWLYTPSAQAPLSSPPSTPLLSFHPPAAFFSGSSSRLSGSFFSLMSTV